MNKTTPENTPFSAIYSWKLIIPVLLGFAVTGFLIFRDFDLVALGKIEWSPGVVFWSLAAVVAWVLSDVFLMFRLRLFTHGLLNFKQVFSAVMILAFAASVLPPVAAATAIFLFVMISEGIKPGRAIAVMLLSSFMDMAFFTFMLPLLLALTSTESVFSGLDTYFASSIIGGSLTITFLLGFFFFFVGLLIYGTGLFVSAPAVKKMLVYITGFRMLSRFRNGAIKTGDEMIIASAEVKKETESFWITAILLTISIWSCRFFVVNCLIAAFGSDPDHFLIYVRQMVMNVLMITIPTPGGSGTAEILFSAFFSEFIPTGLTPVIAILWRLLIFYSYFIIGFTIIPYWIAKTAKRKKPADGDNPPAGF